MQNETTPQKKASRLAALREKALKPQKPLYKFVKPDALRQAPINWNQFKVMPWHEKRSDLTDYFNYGFNEHTFHEYIQKIQNQHEHHSNLIQKTYMDRLNNKELPFCQAQVLTDQTPMDYGGLNVPFDPRHSLPWDANDHHLMDSLLFLKNSMFSQENIDYYWSNDRVLHGNELMLSASEDIKKKLHQDIETSRNEERRIYDFELLVNRIKSHLKLKNSYGAQQNIHNNISILCPQLLIMPERGQLQLAPNLANGVFNGSAILQNKVLPLVQPEKAISTHTKDTRDDEKKHKHKKSRKIKKEKRDKKDKDKKKKKHKRSKKHKRVRENIAIDFEHMESSNEKPFRSHEQSDSEDSYLASVCSDSLSRKIFPVSHIEPCKIEIPIMASLWEQGQGAVIAEQNKGYRHTPSPPSFHSLKPQYLSPNRSCSPEKPKNPDSGVRKGAKDGAWHMNQIQGILQGQAGRRRQL